MDLKTTNKTVLRRMLRKYDVILATHDGLVQWYKAGLMACPKSWDRLDAERKQIRLAIKEYRR